MRHAALTSTFTNRFDRLGTLCKQNASGVHRDPLRRVGRGVLAIAIGILLCTMPDAGSEELQKKLYVDYKTYSLYLLDFNYKQFNCLDELYTHESNWNPSAVNGSHHGIPQGKSDYLASLNGYDQVVWGLSYIGNRYGEPCVALNHWKVYGWH